MNDLRIPNGNCHNFTMTPISQSVPVPLPVRVPVPPKAEDDGAPFYPVPVPEIPQSQQRIVAVAVIFGFVVALICILWIVSQGGPRREPPLGNDEEIVIMEDESEIIDSHIEVPGENLDVNSFVDNEEAEKNEDASETDNHVNNAIIEAQKAKKEKIQNALKNLPRFWHDIALSESENREGYLENSAFLWDNRDYVRIDIVSFVNLNTPLREIESIKIDQPVSHEIAFGITRKGETNRDRIMTLSLKEEGLFYEWNQKTLEEKYNSSDFRQEINRICLSKLRMEFVDESIGLRESVSVSLWAPVVYTAAEFENEKDNDGYFFIWKGDEKRKEFFVVSSNDEWLFLDFDEMFRGGFLPDLMDKKHERYKSLAYAPTFSIDDSRAYCSIEGRNDLKIRMNITSQIVESWEEELYEIIKDGFDLLNKLDLHNKSSNTFRKNYNLRRTGKLREDDFVHLSLKTHPVSFLEKQNERLLQDVEKMQKKLREEIKKLQDDSIEWKDHPTVVDGYKEIKDLEDKIRLNEAEIEPRKELIEYKLWKKTEERDAMKEKITQEKEKWKNIQIKHFTIDLIKTRTLPMEIHKSENRLRLFSVE